MNLDEIRAMGIVEARKLKLEDALKAVYEGQTYQANDYRIEDEHHNAIDQGWEVRNLYDGNLVSRHRIQWTYHEPAKEGRVNDIITMLIEAPEGEVRKLESTVKHTPEPKVQPIGIKRVLAVSAEELAAFKAQAMPVVER